MQTAPAEPATFTRNWRNTWRYAAGIPLILLIGWTAFIGARPVPILSGLDLAIHEFGHLAFFWAPRVVVLAAGSIVQIAFPLSIAIFFAVKREWLGTGLCAAWAGTSCGAVSLYIADAPHGALPLIGEEHDWSALLFEFDAVHRAPVLAAIVNGIGILIWTAGLATCAAGPLLARRSWRREQAPASPSAQPAPPGTPGSGWAVLPPWEDGTSTGPD